MKKIYAIFALFAFLGFAGSVFAAAPVVNLHAADNITQSSARLSVTTTSSSSVSYIFEYGTDPSFGVSTMLPTSSTSVTLNSLNSATTYYYRVQASNADGSTVAPLNGSGNPSYYSFRTLGYNAPVVDTLGADNITQTSATLNGRVNTNGNSGTYYFRYYAGASCGSYLGNTSSQSLSSSSSMQYVSASVSNLSAGQTYCAQLVATIGGTEYPDSKISFTTKTNSINPTTNACTINSFTADSSSVYSGSSTTLRWNTSNCTSVSISDIGNVSTSGSISTGALYSTKYFVLSAMKTGMIDPDTAQVSIGVLPAGGNTYPSCYYSGQCYYQNGQWYYNNNTVNTTTNYPSCYYSAQCYWSRSAWIWNNGGNVNGNYDSYTYNPHTPYTGGPNYVYKTIPGKVNTVYVDQPTTVVTNPSVSYTGDIMSRYSANYVNDYVNPNNRVLLTGAAGNSAQITLIGLLIALIIIAIIVYIVRTSNEKKVH